MPKAMKLEIDPFLYRKVAKVAEAKRLTVEAAALFLLAKVITPRRACGKASSSFFTER